MFTVDSFNDNTTIVTA